MEIYKQQGDVFNINLKQSDNILYACFVCSSLLRLGKSDGALVRFANKTARVKQTGLSYVEMLSNNVESSQRGKK